MAATRSGEGYGQPHNERAHNSDIPCWLASQPTATSCWGKDETVRLVVNNNENNILYDPNVETGAVSSWCSRLG